MSKGIGPATEDFVCASGFDILEPQDDPLGMSRELVAKDPSAQLGSSVGMLVCIEQARNSADDCCYDNGSRAKAVRNREFYRRWFHGRLCNGRCMHTTANSVLTAAPSTRMPLPCPVAGPGRAAPIPPAAPRGACEGASFPSR
jgi:hypothetical protein